MESILENKKVLVVDDEPDILETLEELLYTCSVDTASSFEQAIEFLKNRTYDIAVLDIMGVKGYEILKATNKLNTPALMLTAHALTPDNLKQSIEKGADAYVPKDKLADISMYVADVLTAREQGKTNHTKWFASLLPVFDKLFGTNWRKTDKDFWDEFDKNNL
jgi:CheY-like chemotaxis protein